MGERLASLKSLVKPRPMGKIEKILKDRQDKLKKAEKSLKDKPTHKFAPMWTAQVKGLKAELEMLNELKVYDPAKDQVSVFVRKKLGLFANTEGKSEEEQVAEVRAAFEQADTNKDKTLSMDEFKAIFAALPGNPLAPEHVEGLFKQMDKNNNKVISFDEFFDYMF